MYPDEQLMIKVRDGQLNQMSGLFDRYHVQIYNFFRKMQLDKGLSEDLTQNVFERAMKYKHSYRDDYNFKSWIYRIACNVKNDHFRGVKRDRKAENYIHDRMIASEAHVEQAKHHDKYEHLNMAMQHLDVEQRQLIWLTKYENMKYAEVAELLGYTESNVKIKIFRAMKSLKDIYFKVVENEQRN